MKKIIINADDFGKSPERNRAVDDAFSQGIISSAGLIVTGKFLQNAIDLMEKGGYADKVHIHFNVRNSLLKEGSSDAPVSLRMKKDPFFCKDSLFKTYHGLPKRFWHVYKWKTVYYELVAQFERFKEVTRGYGDYSHIDFHLWYNLTWPVSVALFFFLKKYHIKSARIIGVHQEDQFRYKLFNSISSNRKLLTLPSTNFDYFLSKTERFENEEIVELYCHPDYRDGVFFDISPSYLNHDKHSMLYNIQALRAVCDFELVSWPEVTELK